MPSGWPRRECLANGVTSFHDAGEPLEVVQTFRRLAENGDLTRCPRRPRVVRDGVPGLQIHLYVMVHGDAVLAERLPRRRWVGLGDHHLTVRAIKLFMDGASGAHGAWLLAPYADQPQSTGLNTTPVETIAEARLALRHGFQVCTHAIGDRANREVLNIYSEIFEKHPEKRDLRWRIEHAQHLDYLRHSRGSAGWA